MFSRKLRKRQSQAPPPQEPEPVVYELPPIGTLPKNDLADLSAELVPPLKSSAASIRSESKAPMRITSTVPQFHKPNRLQSPVQNQDLQSHIPPPLPGPASGAGQTSIASLYSRRASTGRPSTSTPTSNGHAPTIDPHAQPAAAAQAQSIPRLPKSPSLQMHKRPKLAPAFNLAVVGARRTGKTSFIRALVSRCELAHQRVSVAGEQDLKRVSAFGAHAGHGTRVKSTEFTESLNLEVLDSRGDRLSLTCVDAPGWDKDSLGEMKAEMVINNFIKSCELRFASSLESEHAVHRTSARPDNHIHCVLYFIDPDTFVWSSAASSTRLRSGSKPLRPTKSATHIRKSSQSANSRSARSSTDTNDLPLPSSPVQKQRDTEELLTSTLDLRMLKKISRRANVVPVIAKADTLTKRQLKEVKEALTRDLKREGLDYGVLEPVTESELATSPTTENGNGPTYGSALDDDPSFDSSARPGRPASIPKSPSAPHLGAGLPLQRTRSRRQSLSRKRRTILNDPEAAPAPSPCTAVLASHLPFALIAPEALPAVDALSPLIREFPWGVVNVTDSEHCDFGLLVQSLLQHHLRSFRESTKGFYERYRTEQLISRRMTQVKPEVSHR